MALSKPVIAAVEGFAVAGGLELAIWCDLRVAAEDATFGVFCRRWGVPLIDGGTVRLPALIGVGRAMDLVLSGREVRAAEALNIGLVNRLAPPGEVLASAQAWAAELAALPQTCLRTDRAALLGAWGVGDETAALAIEFDQGRIALAEVAAGVERFRAGAGRHGQRA
jgi:enoyl-CoA hydratase